MNLSVYSLNLSLLSHTHTHTHKHTHTHINTHKHKHTYFYTIHSHTHFYVVYSCVENLKSKSLKPFSNRSLSLESRWKNAKHFPLISRRRRRRNLSCYRDSASSTCKITFVQIDKKF